MRRGTDCLPFFETESRGGEIEGNHQKTRTKEGSEIGNLRGIRRRPGEVLTGIRTLSLSRLGGMRLPEAAQPAQPSSGWSRLENSACEFLCRLSLIHESAGASWMRGQLRFETTTEMVALVTSLSRRRVASAGPKPSDRDAVARRQDSK